MPEPAVAIPPEAFTQFGISGLILLVFYLIVRNDLRALQDTVRKLVDVVASLNTSIEKNNTLLNLLLERMLSSSLRPNAKSKSADGDPSPRCVVAFDVDGTLEGYGGPITRDIVGLVKARGCLVGLVSGRVDLERVSLLFGVDFIAQWRPGVLVELGHRFKEAKIRVYVADNVERAADARAAGWIFMTPGEARDRLLRVIENA